MARSPAPRPVQTVFDLGHNHQQENTRNAQGWPLRASRNKFSSTPIKTHPELKRDDERAWNKFQVDWEIREERRQSNGLLSARFHENAYASTSNLDETRNRLRHLPSSRPQQDAEFTNRFDPGRSLSYDHRLYQHHPPCPPPSSLSPHHEPQQRRTSRRVSENNRQSAPHPSPSSTSTLHTERFVQDRSDCSDTPTCQADSSAHKLHGLTRRPRVQNPYKRVSRTQGDGPTRSVDLETPRMTKMDCSVMSVTRSNPDGSGTNSRSRFVSPTTMGRPITIRGSDCEARCLETSPSPHVDSETERPQSRIKAPEGAGSASTNVYSILKKEPHTMTVPSLMNSMGGERPSLSSVSTAEAPLPLDQHSLIREDLQQQKGERPIAGCQTDLRFSFREVAAVEDRKSLGFVHSTSPSLQVSSHSGNHPAPANKDDGRKQPQQQVLFQELYQMLEPPPHPGSDPLRSMTEIGRDGEGIIHLDGDFTEGEEEEEEEESSLDNPRGPQGSKRTTLHIDIILAQRAVRDAMQEEEGDGIGLPEQWCLSASSECGEEAVGPNSNLSECGLYRRNSTRSVFDWGYA